MWIQLLAEVIWSRKKRLRTNIYSTFRSSGNINWPENTWSLSTVLIRAVSWLLHWAPCTNTDISLKWQKNGTLRRVTTWYHTCNNLISNYQPVDKLAIAVVNLIDNPYMSSFKSIYISNMALDCGLPCRNFFILGRQAIF